MSDKPNCYECKFRGTVAGSAHSCCEYPGNKTGILDMFIQDSNNRQKLKIVGNKHGIRNGWFMWPVDFDPTWLENCEGFEEK